MRRLTPAWWWIVSSGFCRRSVRSKWHEVPSKHHRMLKFTITCMSSTATATIYGQLWTPLLLLSGWNRSFQSSPVPAKIWSREWRAAYADRYLSAARSTLSCIWLYKEHMRVLGLFPVPVTLSFLNCVYPVRIRRPQWISASNWSACAIRNWSSFRAMERRFAFPEKLTKDGRCNGIISGWSACGSCTDASQLCSIFLPIANHLFPFWDYLREEGVW